MFIIRLQQYSVWFFVNFIVCCVTPLFFAYLSNREGNQIFSGYLSYSFTLLISCFYLFQVILYMKDKKSIPNFSLWGTIFWVIVLFALFSFFPEIPQTEIKSFISNNIWLITIVIFIITLGIALSLSKQSVEDLVAKIYADQQRAENERIKKSVSKMKDELEKEQ